MTKGSFYITTPIYYVNDSPHLGHAYTTIACDVMARFMRLDGYDVKFLTGTDEHGQKVDKAAKAAGVEPQGFTDDVSQRFRHLVKGGDNLLGVSNTDFIRTTEPRHKQACAALWERLVKNGHVYKDTYGGWYAVRDEAYYQEAELVEKDGKKLAPTGADVEWVEEESYFFRLSAFQDRLLALYDSQPDFIRPKTRHNEVYSFVKGGLKDLSISRTTFQWGVPVPGDDRHVMYVWIDALTNYLTSAGFPDITGAEFKTFWAGAAHSPIHVVGKDIVRFHAVYWPAFLMAADVPLPRHVFAHGWWTIEGEKMSKSLGNVIAPADLVNDFGLDATRYFLLREVPFGNDGNFAREAMVNRINSELANTIGNLAQRSLSIIQKNCEGRVPEAGQVDSEEYRALHEAIYSPGWFEASYRQPMLGLQFNAVLESVLSIAVRGNAFIDKEAPWALKKTDPARMQHVLYMLAETIRAVAIMLRPFMPGASDKMLEQLGVAEAGRHYAALSEKDALKPGTPLPPPSGVFPRYEGK